MNLTQILNGNEGSNNRSITKYLRAFTEDELDFMRRQAVQLALLEKKLGATENWLTYPFEIYRRILIDEYNRRYKR